MKKVLSSLLMTGTLLLTAAAPLVANAESVPNTTGKTDVTASFTGNTNPVTPVDPDDPNKPVDPDPGTNGSTSGNEGGGQLSLIYAPKTFNFGSHQIDVLNDQSYALDTSDTTIKTSLWGSANNVVLEVSDVRGTNAGWNLTASGSELKSGDDKLVGASITLPGGDVTASGATKTNGAVSVAAKLATTGEAQTVLNAAAGNGAGVTVDQIKPSEIKLNVPANTAKAQTYTGSINWNLSDTPAQ
ncbi:WxL domain-containing protein [Lactiplantibacillus plajomi]|uniref:WxL domain-containing protein n=1 Tax=Lactiplantibacillus plajomi TaxID=1457217 RepID=A0ABV6K838_9LACO|nr:WxL domain-containing protein [Lactiplantibacillus plajomi]